MYVVMGNLNEDGTFKEVVTTPKRFATINEDNRKKYEYINENAPADIAENIDQYKVVGGDLVLKNMETDV